MFIDFEMLCQLPHRMHVFWTDKNHIILGANQLQCQLTQKLMNIPVKDSKDLVGYTIFDIYKSYNSEHRAKELIQENEKVLSLNKPLTFNSTFYLPDDISIELITIKIPFYDKFQRLSGVLGLAHYLREIDLAKSNYWKLSIREVECLEQLILGKTAKNIGQALNLSHRTVEFYLENIKNKLSCDSKEELIAKAKALQLVKRYIPAL